MDTTTALYHPLRLGSLTIPGNVFLAPLAGYTDRAFREIATEFGASFVYTEMVSAEAIARGNEKTYSLMQRGEREDLLGIQIFLADAEQAERAIAGILNFNPSLIDINCGCPVPKIVKTGAGAALMQSPETIHHLVSILTKVTSVPITVKIRSGWDESESTTSYMEAGHAAAEAGVKAVGLHARTRAQGYSGTSRWEHIAKLSETLDVPVIGSGDLFTSEAVRQMLAETGCDAVMCARGAIGNPFIFDAERADEKVYAEEKIRTAFRHYRKALYYEGEHSAVKEMKKHFAAYTKGLPGGSALRNELMRCGDGECYRRVFSDYLKFHGLDPGSLD